MVKFFDWMVILFEFYHWFFSVESFSPKWRTKCQIEEMKNTKKSLPRLVGESPDHTVDHLNYTLNQEAIPNRGGVARSGKSAVLIIVTEQTRNTISNYKNTWTSSGIGLKFRTCLYLGVSFHHWMCLWNTCFQDSACQQAEFI